MWHLTYLAIGPLVVLPAVALIDHLREWKIRSARWLTPTPRVQHPWNALQPR